MIELSHGMVLAAGLGLRMRPLTEHTAKPLLTLAGRTLLDHALDRLQDAGVQVAVVNAHPEVAHNYARDHRLNMWFVLATEDESRIEATVRAIEAETGLPVLNMPREAEYHVGLRLEA